MNITVRQLRAFLAASERASFTRAGEHLGLSQSAVSMLVADLEHELDLRLLDRTTRRVEPTEAGQAFALQAQRVLAGLDAAVGEARDLALRRRGRLAVFAPPLLAATLLPRAIVAHRAHFPGIAIAVQDGGTGELPATVRSGHADFAIGTVSANEENLDPQPVARDRLVLFCPAGHRLAARRRVPWGALEGEAVIALTPQSGLRRLVEDASTGAGVALHPAYEVAQIATALALVAAGLGIAVLPSIARAACPPKLAMRPLIAPEIGRDIQIIRRAGRSLSPAGASFVATLRSELARLAQGPTLLTCLAE